MLRSVIATVAIATLLCGVALAAKAPKEVEYIPGRYTVRLSSAAPSSAMTEVQGLVHRLHTSTAEEHTHMHGAVGERTLSLVPAFEIYEASAAMAEHLRTHEHVEHVSQQHKMEAFAVTSWGLDRIDQATLPLDDTYAPTGDGSGTNIYVVDTGCDFEHDDFQNSGRTVENIYNYYGSTSTDTDGHGHGTHVAGTAGGETYGVAPQANLYGLKVLSDSGSGTDFGVASGIDYAAAHAASDGNPSIISMSLGGYCGTNWATCEADIVNVAVEAAADAGVVVSVAAGNDYDDACYYSPASAVSALTVGSTESDDDASSFTNYGTCVDILAPGTSIVSSCASSACGDESSSATYSGTSMACPHVSGVAALVMAADTGASPDDVLEYLLCGASTDQIDQSTASGESRNYLLQSGSEDLPTCTLGDGCTNDCSNKGTCDSSTGTCWCFDPTDTSSDCSSTTPAPTSTPAPTATPAPTQYLEMGCDMDSYGVDDFCTVYIQTTGDYTVGAEQVWGDSYAWGYAEVSSEADCDDAAVAAVHNPEDVFTDTFTAGIWVCIEMHECSVDDCSAEIVVEAVVPATPSPTALPTTAAPNTATPTSSPTTPAPTPAPTTPAPTPKPTMAPTASPTTPAPTASPTTPAPTAAPTAAPTHAPNVLTSAPSPAPTMGDIHHGDDPEYTLRAHSSGAYFTVENGHSGDWITGSLESLIEYRWRRRGRFPVTQARHQWTDMASTPVDWESAAKSNRKEFSFELERSIRLNKRGGGGGGRRRRRTHEVTAGLTTAMFNESANITSGRETIPVSANEAKFTVSVENWYWKHSHDMLYLNMHFTVPDASELSYDSSTNEIAISSSMSMRMASTAVVDGRSRKAHVMSVSGNSTDFDVVVRVPHFDDTLVYDPVISVGDA